MIDDIENLFKNSKMQNAFSGDGLDALANWNFWVEPLFYCVALITVIYIFFIPIGIAKDSSDKS